MVETYFVLQRDWHLPLMSYFTEIGAQHFETSSKSGNNVGESHLLSSAHSSLTQRVHLYLFTGSQFRKWDSLRVLILKNLGTFLITSASLIIVREVDLWMREWRMAWQIHSRLLRKDALWWWCKICRRVICLVRLVWTSIKQVYSPVMSEKSFMNESEWEKAVREELLQIRLWERSLHTISTGL